MRELRSTSQIFEEGTVVEIPTDIYKEILSITSREGMSPKDFIAQVLANHLEYLGRKRFTYRP